MVLHLQIFHLEPKKWCLMDQSMDPLGLTINSKMLFATKTVKLLLKFAHPKQQFSLQKALLGAPHCQGFVSATCLHFHFPVDNS